MKSFPVNVVVTAYRNRHLCDFKEYRSFLDYMVGAKVYLWDVAAARIAVAAHLERGIPLLKKTEAPPEKTDSGAGSRYMKGVAKVLHADDIPVRPLPKGAFTPRDFAEVNA